VGETPPQYDSNHLTEDADGFASSGGFKTQREKIIEELNRTGLDSLKNYLEKNEAYSDEELRILVESCKHCMFCRKLKMAK
jgi:hypothetical protein